MDLMERRHVIGSDVQRGDGLEALSRRAELLILCARIGFNPPA